MTGRVVTTVGVMSVTAVVMKAGLVVRCHNPGGVGKGDDGGGHH